MLKYIEACLTFGIVITHLRPQHTPFFSHCFHAFYATVVRVRQSRVLWTSIPLKIIRIFMTIFSMDVNDYEKKMVTYVRWEFGNYFHDITFMIRNFKMIELSYSHQCDSIEFHRFSRNIRRMNLLFKVQHFRKFPKRSNAVWSVFADLFGVNSAFNAQCAQLEMMHLFHGMDDRRRCRFLRGFSYPERTKRWYCSMDLTK